MVGPYAETLFPSEADAFAGGRIADDQQHGHGYSVPASAPTAGDGAAGYLAVHNQGLMEFPLTVGQHAFAPPAVTSGAGAKAQTTALPLDINSVDLTLGLDVDLMSGWDSHNHNHNPTEETQAEMARIQSSLRRAQRERDEARMALSTMRNEVYSARQVEKRLRAERDEARSQVLFLKKERAAARTTEQRLRRERNAARMALASCRCAGRKAGGKKDGVQVDVGGREGSPMSRSPVTGSLGSLV
ncbi:hypothetical protein B0T16DRAFT_388562 [Cercophora newfieldiana]|uniref:Uncharacterized protein n=1 Tax=Cercophora newfieldiana TaxID=92897 RepID=A0AA40CR33_9PEZI|nr:hypothetical protein B0T16DRAFT_388562 [Cercophora newfieldiana]